MCHPILAATSALGSVLARVAEASPVFLTTAEKADALRGLARVQAQLDELRLRVLAAAADVAETTAARDAGEWLANATHTRFEDARADLALAVALDRRYAVLGAALRAGQANTAQAEVIARALDALPEQIDDRGIGSGDQSSFDTLVKPA